MEIPKFNLRKKLNILSNNIKKHPIKLAEFSSLRKKDPKDENISLIVKRNGLKKPVYVGDTQGDFEACKKAGFSLTLPKEEEPCEKIFRVMPGQMIEVIYLAEDSRELLRIRKGKDMSEDISGVYEKYAVSEVLDPDGMNIAVSGDKEDSWEIACWTQTPEEDCLYSYSITTQRDALTGEEIIRMAEEMMAES